MEQPASEHIPCTIKFDFNENGMKMKKIVLDPFTGETKELEINELDYEGLENLHEFSMVVHYIRPKIENGIWKGLEFGVSNISSEKEPKVKRTEYPGYGYNEDSGTASKIEVEEPVQDDMGFSSFPDRLGYSQKARLDKFLEKIRELGDNKIRVESYHKQHIAIKYHKGRAKAWMVIKASGNNLFLWLRVDPRSFKDDKNLTVLYDDSSKTHGNRRLDLMSSKIEDVMELVRQSYEFRKSDDFYEKYSGIVRTIE